MRLAVKHIVWLTLLLYLLSGFGSAFGAFWCPSLEEGCGLGAASAPCCVPQTGAVTTPVSAGGLHEAECCASCLDIELQFPTLKSRVRPLRVPVISLSFQPTVNPVRAALAFAASPFSSAPDEPGPLLAQRHLRTVVLLN
ncbi:hypothetical protein [Trichloromonas sp.]|uniref:hypothetical protein n=1 Tax=Trichloromonas sp. TaxID=3069249 RepID=UPI003D81BD38